MIQQWLESARQHHQAGRLDQARDLYCQILARQGDHPEALHLSGLIAFQTGRLDEALELIRKAASLDPKRADYHCNLGLVLAAMKLHEQAIAAYRQALTLRPDYPQAYNNLGNSLRHSGQFDQAIEAFSRALALRPDYFEAQNNLGNVLAAQRQWDQAIEAFRQALALHPTPEIYNNLGMALKDSGQIDLAIEAFGQALALGPDSAADIYLNLGNALKDAGQIDPAIAAYRQAVRIKPDSSAAHSNIICSVYFHPDYDSAAIFQELCQWDRQHAQGLRASIKPHENDRTPDRRLRIGYVSPDFRAQAEAHFVAPLLRSHDHRQFEIHCYASVKNPDAVTDQMRGFADAWHDVLALSDADLAGRIRDDRIDVLVDLTMHMCDNRLLTFARKPAPVQVTWLAYPGSTGLQTMDYRFTDPLLEPPAGSTPFYSEQSIVLRPCWCCYFPLHDLPLQSVRPPGPIRFGSLNNPCKLNDAVLRLWAQVLRSVPESRLILLASAQSQRQRIRDLMHGDGVDPGRLEFVSRLRRDDYLKIYDRIDIALDPLPYNGITTTCDALWMGAAVVSLTGATAAGRAGLSLLSSVGLSELVAENPRDSVDRASDLASDAPRLAELRRSLRDRMAHSPLMDAASFAAAVEAAYRQMWRQWCAA